MHLINKFYQEMRPPLTKEKWSLESVHITPPPVNYFPAPPTPTYNVLPNIPEQIVETLLF